MVVIEYQQGPRGPGIEFEERVQRTRISANGNHRIQHSILRRAEEAAHQEGPLCFTYTLTNLNLLRVVNVQSL